MSDCARKKGVKMSERELYTFAIRAGVRWSFEGRVMLRCREEVDSLRCRDVNSSEEVYMCTIRAGVSVRCCHLEDACPM